MRTRGLLKAHVEILILERLLLFSTVQNTQHLWHDVHDKRQVIKKQNVTTTRQKVLTYRISDFVKLKLWKVFVSPKIDISKIQ